jgi:hypothetical protein
MSVTEVEWDREAVILIVPAFPGRMPSVQLPMPRSHKGATGHALFREIGRAQRLHCSRSSTSKVFPARQARDRNSCVGVGVGSDRLSSQFDPTSICQVLLCPKVAKHLTQARMQRNWITCLHIVNWLD